MVWGEEQQGLVSRTIAESVRMERVEVSEGLYSFPFVDLAGDISQFTLPYCYCMSGELIML